LLDPVSDYLNILVNASNRNDKLACCLYEQVPLSHRLLQALLKQTVQNEIEIAAEMNPEGLLIFGFLVNVLESENRFIQHIISNGTVHRVRTCLTQIVADFLELVTFFSSLSQMLDKMESQVFVLLELSYT
jgi:hypothetical protein